MRAHHHPRQELAEVEVAVVGLRLDSEHEDTCCETVELRGDAASLVPPPEAADLAAGERALLLIGNQGTGKNKLADRLLQLWRREREYMQLHRDTTVRALTATGGNVNAAVERLLGGM